MAQRKRVWLITKRSLDRNQSSLIYNAVVAQSVERKTFNLVVVGSIPTEGALLGRHSIVVIAPAS